MSPDTKVSELIDQDKAAWKSEVVQQLFLPQEASEILGIPLSERLPPDRIIWACTPSGMFTTSSAYKLIISCELALSASPSNPKAQRQFWKRIWQLRTPNKIKHFVGRCVTMLYPPWRSSTTAILSHQKFVKAARIEQRTHYMPFSFAKKLLVCGIQWSGFTKM